jgi:hypothetical protein
LSHLSSKHWRAGAIFMDFSEKPHQLFGASIMSKEQKSNKEDKKKPLLSPKEKKAAKKSKKDSKS